MIDHDPLNQEAFQSMIEQARAVVQDVEAHGVRAVAARVKELAEALAADYAELVGYHAAATSEISRNAAETATGAQDVSSTVARILAAANETGSAAKQSLAVKQEVDAFLRDIQAV